MVELYTAPEVIERSPASGGDIQLQRRGEHYEIISNGTFLMATYNGESERLLVNAAFEAAAQADRVLIGGLGVGFSLAEALSYEGVKNVTVIEIESKVIEWNRTYLAPYSNNSLKDNRTHVIEADLIDWIRKCEERYDMICLDIDNGPDWTVTESNNSLYEKGSLGLLARLLTPKGAVAFWSASSSCNFLLKLRHIFEEVKELSVPQPRGEADYIYAASRPKF